MLVLSLIHISHLGGDDFDQVIIDWLVQEFKNDEGAALTQDPLAMQRLKEAAEKAKSELSSSTSTEKMCIRDRGRPCLLSCAMNGSGLNSSTFHTPGFFHNPLRNIMAPIMAGTPVV